MFGTLLTPTQCQRLREHKYNCEGRSILEFVFQPFWSWLVTKLPFWLAPNVITLCGFLSTLLPSITLIYYCPTAREEPPSSLLFLTGLCLFIYQTLDAVDGKQARRLNQCSPLGEAFDHGCDSVGIVFAAIAFSIAVKLGEHPGYYFVWNFTILSTFYLGIWGSYVTGKLKFGRVDVTELLVMAYTCFFFNAYFGTGFLSYQLMKLPYFGPVAFWHLGFYICIVAAVFRVIREFSIIMTGGVGKNGSSVAETSILSPAIPGGLVLLSACYVFKHSDYKVFQNEPNIAFLVFGMCFAKLIWKLLL